MGKLVFILLVVAAAIVIVGYLLGWRADTVLSGSMEPILKVGGLVVARPITPADIKVGDIIMFSLSPGDTVCHRVVAINTEPSLLFVTQGDANDHADPNPVMPSQVLGIVCFHVPYVGYIIQYIKSPLIMGGIIVLVIFIVYLSWVSSREK